MECEYRNLAMVVSCLCEGALKLRIFILDDDRFRLQHFREIFSKHKLTVADSYAKAVQLFNPPYDVIFLDHDLGEEENGNGYDFALLISSMGYQGPSVIHSWNPDGAERMRKTLNGFSAKFGGIDFNKILRRVNQYE